MSRASASRRTPSPAITGFAETTSSWSAGRTSTARRSWSRRTRQASRRVRLADRFNTFIREDLKRPRAVVRPLQPDDDAEPLQRHAGLVPNALRRRAIVVERRRSARSPPPRATRSPTATSRARVRSAASPNARGDQCDNCGNQLDPIDLIEPRSRIDGTPPVFVRRSTSSSTSRRSRTSSHAGSPAQDGLAAERAAVLAELRAGAQAAPDHARSRLGRPDPRRGVRGSRRQADLRLVRRRHRLPLGVDRVGARTAATPEAWREWWQNPDAEHTYFMGKDNIVFHTVIWPSMLLGYGEGGELRRGSRGAEAAGQRRVERVPDDGGQEVQREPRRSDPRPRLPEPLRPGRASLLPHRSPGPRRRTRTSPGPSSSAATTTSSSRPGATSSTAHCRAPTRTSARSRRPGALTAEDETLLREVEQGFDDRRLADRGCSVPQRAPGDDEARRAREPVHGGAGSLGEARGRARARGDDPVRRAARRRQPQDAARAVPAVLGAAAARAARLRRRHRRRARVPHRRRGRRRARGAHGRLRAVGRVAGSRASSPPGQTLREPAPLFAKLDAELVVAEELERMEAATAA